MEEEAAREWLIREFDVPRETMERLDGFIGLLKVENDAQNLVSKASLNEIWNRHILDSAQLLRFRPSEDASWLDLGTGAGFPGLVIGLLHQGQVTLVEERRKRADWLSKAAEFLGLGDKVAIRAVKAERLDSAPVDVISARAFAPLERLFKLSHSFSTAKTRWILPKGRTAASELEAAEASWQGAFRLEQSLTDADAWIIVAERVSRKALGRPAKGRIAR